MFGTTFRDPAVLPGYDLYPKIAPLAAVPGVSFMHGSGSTGDYCLSPLGSQNGLTQLVASNWSAVSGNYGNSWGNDTARADAQAYLNHMYSRLSPSAPDDYALIGASMGGLNALAFATQATVKPRCIVLELPAVNPGDIFTNNRSGYAAEINTAWAGAYDPAGGPEVLANPYLQRDAAGLAGIPMLIFYGTTDALCLPSFTEAFGASDTPNRTLVPVVGGHALPTYDLMDHDQIFEFLATNLA